MCNTEHRLTCEHNRVCCCQALPPVEIEAHQFTGIWRKWHHGYNPEDSHSRDAFLTANLARTHLARTSILERAIKRKETEAAGSLHQSELGAANTTVAFGANNAICDKEDHANAQHEMAETDEQGVPVNTAHQ